MVVSVQRWTMFASVKAKSRDQASNMIQASGGAEAGENLKSTLPDTLPPAPRDGGSFVHAELHGTGRHIYRHDKQTLPTFGPTTAPGLVGRGFPLVPMSVYNDAHGFRNQMRELMQFSRYAFRPGALPQTLFVRFP